MLIVCDASNAETREKRFALVKCFLNGMRTVEMNYKLSLDLITRLCQELHTFASDELNWILEHCVDDMRAGDAKCVAWKDLLPETLLALIAKQRLIINDIAMAGPEFRDSTVRNLCTMRWPCSILTPIANMFRLGTPQRILKTISLISLPCFSVCLSLAMQSV